ncbi:MAG: hypothetical protein AAFX54_03150 [Pseudomonadota bacterium]
MSICAVLVGITGVVSTGAANACYTVKFDNKADQDVKVLWRAAGCGAMEHWVGEVCSHKTVNAKSASSYNYKWGTTAPTIVIYEKVDRLDEIKHQITYRIKHGKFVNEDGRPESAPSCGKSYSISFSQDDWDTNFK